MGNQPTFDSRTNPRYPPERSIRWSYANLRSVMEVLDMSASFAGVGFGYFAKPDFSEFVPVVYLNSIAAIMRLDGCHLATLVELV